MPPEHNPDEMFTSARQFIRKLGLPIAWDKIVPPCRVIRFLGVIIDCVEREIRMPEDKIRAFLSLANEIRGKRSISRRELQSLVGHVNHLGKGVPPARLFMNRMLAALRAATRKWIRVDELLKADLTWFITFLRTYNGRSLIVTGEPDIVIEADSCMSGRGAWSNEKCYTYEYAPDMVSGWSISELKTYNCLIAARVLLDGVENRVVNIICDNSAAISSLSSGSARDTNILAICRAFWFLSAEKNLRFTFRHAPGVQMTIADKLSRAYISILDAKRAEAIIRSKGLKGLPVLPCHVDIMNYF